EVRNDCRDVDCAAFMGTTRLQATSGAQPEELLTARTAVKKRQRSLSANDARPWYDESPTSPLWASYMRKANEVARELCAPSKREQRISLAGRFTTFRRTHEQPMNEESCAAFLLAILDVASSTRPQYARTLRSMFEMYLTPLGMMILGLQKVAARSETKQTRPLKEEERDESSYPQSDRMEGTCCLTTCVDNGESLAQDCGLNPKNSTMEPDGALILNWSVAPKTAKADPTEPRGSSAYENGTRSTL
ncbi:hypothetical protein TcCL_ESM07683, partial [Trypanosoma cruzi]